MFDKIAQYFTILLSILLVSIFEHCSTKRLNFEQSNNLTAEMQTEDLHHLVLEIINTRIGDLNCLAVICDLPNIELLNGVYLNHLGGLPVYRVLIEESEDLFGNDSNTLDVLREVRKDGCRGFIIFLSGDQIAQLLQYGDSHREIDTRAIYILLHDYRLYKPDLHYLWKKIVNVVFIKQHFVHYANEVHSSWYELTTVPFPMPIRGVLVPRRLEVWKKGRLVTGGNLFREKTSDLRGQVLRVATFQHMPAIVKPLSMSNNTGLRLYKGIEIEILRALVPELNFQPVLYEVANDEQWGRPQVNGTYDGLLGEIVSGQADVVLGNFHYTPFYLDILDLTVPYDTQCLTFLTPESIRDISWKTLILPFKPVMWAALLTTLFLGGFVFHALSRFYTFLQPSRSRTSLFGQLENSIIYTFGMLLLISLPKLPEGWALRMVTGSWWLYCVLVVVAYRASMTAILANPAPRVTVDTMEQLATNHMGCSAWGQPIKDFFQTSLDVSGQKIGEKLDVVYDAETAVDRVTHGQYAFYENFYYLQYAIVKQKELMDKRVEKGENNIGSSPLHIMRDCVIHMPISIGLQKNSPLKPRIDEYIVRYVEAGLVKKWLNDAMWEVNAALTPDKTDKKALMDLRKLYGALVALGLGYLLGGLALLGETIHWKYAVLRDPSFDKYNPNKFYNMKIIQEAVVKG